MLSVRLSRPSVISGDPPPELTVGYLTTTVGAMQAGYVLGALTGSSAMPHQGFQFDLGMPC
jgi:hypothetical protein